MNTTTTNFMFKKFRYESMWHVIAAGHGRIGSTGQFFEDGKRNGFDAIVRVHDEDGHITGFETIGTGFKTRTEAAQALLAHTEGEA